MKHPFYKSLIAAGMLAVAGGMVACGDDTPSNPPQDNPNNQASNVCAGVVTTDQAYVIDLGNGSKYVVYPTTGAVTDAAGNAVGSYNGTAIVDAAGAVLLNVDATMLTNVCEANTSVGPGGELIPVSSSATAPASSNSNPVAGSSSSVGPVAGSSSAVVPPASSNSNPELDENGFPTIESYGAPPAEYTVEIQNNGKTGWSSRYWDACKPHCSWLSSVDTTSEETYQAGMTVARNCNIHDVEVPAFTLGHAVQQYWMGYEGTPSACVNENAGGTYTCTDMAPIAVNDTLAYGYVAGSGSLYKFGCGKCYHLQFNGGNHANDVKATHKALKGKHMVVMVSNIGYDVEAGQFDMMVPGGGVGAFNALSTQIGVPASGLGANGGGFLTECQSSLGWDNTVEKYQECVIAKCESVFKDWPNLLRGCKWYAEWYMAADNPTFNWEEVECPQYLVDHYVTNINTTKDNRYRWRDDWSDYKAGDVLETQECLTDEFPGGCAP